MLIIHGAKDRNVPLAAAAEHHRLVPQSEFVVLDENHFCGIYEAFSILGSASALLKPRTLSENFQALPNILATPIPTDGWNAQGRERPLRFTEIAPPKSARGKHCQIARTD